jgi:hypothetical protein
MESFEKLFQTAMDAYDEREVGPKISRINKTGLDVE